jgi:hypothetical protein
LNYATKNIGAIRDQCRVKADAAVPWGTPAWITKYRSLLFAPAPVGQRSFIEKSADLLNLIAAASTAPATSRPVYMLWHSFEYGPCRPTGMGKNDPRRHWCEVTPSLSAVTSVPIDISPDTGYRLFFENLCFVIDKAGEITAIAGAELEEIATLVNLDLQDWAAARSGLPYP